MLWHRKIYIKKSRGIGISHASFWYLTNGAQFLFSSAVRFWFQIIFQIILGRLYRALRKEALARAGKNTFKSKCARRKVLAYTYIYTW